MAAVNGRTGRSAEREEAEALYQFERELARAKTDEEKARVRERFAEAEAERRHRRQLQEEDRLFGEQQARERQAFEDRLADEGLAKQIRRITQEKAARLEAIREETAARQAALVATAQTSLQRIIEDVNSAVNSSIGKLFDSLQDEMRRRGGPTDPGFLGRVRNDVAGLIVPVAGMLQSFLANLAGIGNTYGSGVSLPVPTTPTSELPWFAQPGSGAPGWLGTTSTGYGTTTSRDVHLHVNGQFYGSPADLARVLQPELARIGAA